MSVNSARLSYYQARREYELAKSNASRLKSMMDSAKVVLIDKMLVEEQKSIKCDDGTHVILRRAFNFSATKDNVETTRAWLVESIGDDAPFVRTVIDKAALGEKLREMVDDEGVDPDTLPEFLHVSTRPDVTVRGWADVKDEEGRDDERF